MTPSLDDKLLLEPNVSRETMARLGLFVQLLLKWNTAINLVSKATIDRVWSRHIIDSIQIFDHAQTEGHWADLGSGGGFPGVVVAILAKERVPELRVTLVESDQRKAAFLRQASQALALNTHVMSDRVEIISPLNANIISARALAPLPQLCAFAHRHLAPTGEAIFLKGKSYEAEITDARKDWNFSLDSHVSVTDPSAVVLVLKGISHV